MGRLLYRVQQLAQVLLVLVTLKEQWVVLLHVQDRDILYNSLPYQVDSSW